MSKYICPRCKHPAEEHAPWRSFCNLKESEALKLIIDLQAKSIQENAEDKRRIDMLDYYLMNKGWIDMGFNGPMQELMEDGSSRMVGNSEYYLDSDYANTFREAIDKFIAYQNIKEEY